MLKIIIGVKGTGKTKILIDMVNKATEESKGSVICIEKGSKLRSEVKFRTRLVNSEDYAINSAEALYGFMAGMLAGNHDVTDIFVDATLKICNKDVEACKAMFVKLDALSEKCETNIVMTFSAPIEDATDDIKKFIIN
ncbi:MAG: hypothetical protein J5894_00425 [Clostridia bacterium]|nr:hypothetical protein [Clostridia bacterium]